MIKGSTFAIVALLLSNSQQTQTKAAQLDSNTSQKVAAKDDELVTTDQALKTDRHVKDGEEESETKHKKKHKPKQKAKKEKNDSKDKKKSNKHKKNDSKSHKKDKKKDKSSDDKEDKDKTEKNKEKKHDKKKDETQKKSDKASDKASDKSENLTKGSKKSKDEDTDDKVYHASKDVKKAAKELKEAESTEQKKIGLQKLKAAQEKRKNAEDQQDAEASKKQDEQDKALSKKETKPEKVDKDLAKLEPADVARVKQAEVDGKGASTKAQIEFEKAIKSDSDNLNKLSTEENKVDKAKEAIKSAKTDEDLKSAKTRLNTANAQYKDALEDRIESKQDLLKASQKKAKSVVQESKQSPEVQNASNIFDAKQLEKDGSKAKEEADKKVEAAEKAVNKAEDDIEKEKAHVKLLEAKQQKLEAKAQLQQAKVAVKDQQEKIDSEQANDRIENELEKEDARELEKPPPTNPKKLKKELEKRKSKKLTSEVEDAVKKMDKSTTTKNAEPEKKEKKHHKSKGKHHKSEKKHSSKKHSKGKKHMNLAQEKTSHSSSKKSKKHHHKKEKKHGKKHDKKDSKPKHQWTADEISNAAEAYSQRIEEKTNDVQEQSQDKVQAHSQVNKGDMKGFFKKSDTFKQFEQSRDKEMKEEKDENQKINKELKDMKDKFKHLMSDYVSLKKKIKKQDKDAANLNHGSFQPEMQQSFNHETPKGMKEDRNLLGAKTPQDAPTEPMPVSSLNEQINGLNQHLSPVLGPAATGQGHQPTPVAGIAKPKAKGKNLPKAVVQENDNSKQMIKKSNLPPAGPAASATGHQPTPVAGIAKPKAKARQAVRTEPPTHNPVGNIFQPPTSLHESFYYRSQVPSRAQIKRHRFLRQRRGQQSPNSLYSHQPNQHFYSFNQDSKSSQHTDQYLEPLHRAHSLHEGPRSRRDGVHDRLAAKKDKSHEPKANMIQGRKHDDSKSLIIHSAPVSRHGFHSHHELSKHPHHDHINLQLDAKDYGTQNKVNDAGQTVAYNQQGVVRYEGEIKEDKRLFDFEDPGDY